VGTYSFNGGASCNVTCTATACTDSSGNLISLTVLPTFALSLDDHWANAGDFSSGASLGGDLQSSAHFTNFGILSGASPGPQMTGKAFTNQGGFVGPN
jgi:hypothetical protein